jgi:hypothetical protein
MAKAGGGDRQAEEERHALRDNPLVAEKGTPPLAQRGEFGIDALPY